MPGKQMDGEARARLAFSAWYDAVPKEQVELMDYEELHALEWGYVTGYLASEAAHAGEMERLREALKPFAEVAELFDDESWAEDDEIELIAADFLQDRMTVFDFRAARLALNPPPRSPEGETP